MIDDLVLELYVVELLDRGLDSSTVGGHIQAVWDVYNYLSTSVPGLQGLVNPAEGPRLKQTRKTINALYKLASKSKRPIAKDKAKAIMAGGFRTGLASLWRQDRHAELYYVLITLSMLRQGALSQLVVDYSVEAGRVVFGKDSAVTILHDATYGAYVQFRIEVDKNVTAEKVRYAYIPSTPGMGVDAPAMLAAYLLEVRPPSGGYLFAYPYKGAKVLTFSTAVYKTFSARLREAYVKTFPLANVAEVEALGSHSGRKSLAQWLWEDGFAKRFIADIGGWFIKQEAVDLYFASSREMILEVLAMLGLSTTSAHTRARVE